MKRSLFLDSTHATKNADDTYTFNFQRGFDVEFKAFLIKSCVVTLSSLGTIPHSLKLHSEFFNRIRLGPTVQHTTGRNSDALETVVYKGALTTSLGIYNMEYQPSAYSTDNEHLDKVDIAFRDPTGAIADVDSFAISMDLMNDTSQL